jgi:hypothetical protein
MSCQIPIFKKLAKSDLSLKVYNALFLQERCEVKFQITPLVEYTMKHALAAVTKKNDYPSIAVNYALFMPLYTYIL